MDQPHVTGVIQADTEIDVYYTKQTYTLTVRFQNINGQEMTDTIVEQLQTGDTYRITVPTFENYEVVGNSVIEGTMSGQNREVIVTYAEKAGTNEEGLRIYTLTGRPSVLINDYMTPLGLSEVNRGYGETIE